MCRFAKEVLVLLNMNTFDRWNISQRAEVSSSALQSLSSTDCQTADFTFLSNGNWITCPLRSTHRGTWIKRYIKESTSVSLSGSPLKACSFLICGENKKEEEAQQDTLFSIHINCLSSLTLLCDLKSLCHSYFAKKTKSHRQTHKCRPPLRQAGASAGLWAAPLRKSFLLLFVCLQQWSGWIWKTVCFSKVQW